MSLPRYEEYRDSGIPWLGKIPKHWKIFPLKAIAKGDSCAFIDGDWIESKHISDGGIRYITTGNVGPGFYKEQGMGYISEETFTLLNCTEVLPGDILISRLNAPIGRACVVPDLGLKIVTSVDNVIVRPSTLFHREFLVFRLSSPDYFYEAGNLASGATMQRISRSELGNVRIAFPPREEQTAIAAFLDRETTKIDALITEQEKLIALLAEKRQATISHAVTRGLDPAAPLKDSGVEWLGQVPAHWEASSLKRVVSLIESGVSVNSIDEPAGEDAIGVLKTSCVYSGEFNPAENKMVIIEELERVSCQVKAGTLIVSRMNTPALVGAAGLAKNSAENLFLPDRLWQVHFYGALPEFAHYWTQTCQYRTQVKMACAGTSASMQNLSQEEFLSFQLSLPPKQEQCAIAAFLERETAKMDALASEQWKAISLLRERRAALIAAAVTGQIDVRGLVDAPASPAPEAA